MSNAPMITSACRSSPEVTALTNLPSLSCRYPFSDLDHTNLFMKISRGNFSIPDSVSIKAKCLIRNLMRREPKERISSEDVLLHPWVIQDDEKPEVSKRTDQVVPDIDFS